MAKEFYHQNSTGAQTIKHSRKDQKGVRRQGNMEWNQEHDQTRSLEIFLVSSALVPEETLGLIQKMTDKLLGHWVWNLYFAFCFLLSYNCIDRNSKNIAIVSFIMVPLKCELLLFGGCVFSWINLCLVINKSPNRALFKYQCSRSEAEIQRWTIKSSNKKEVCVNHMTTSWEATSIRDLMCDPSPKPVQPRAPSCSHYWLPYRCTDAGCWAAPPNAQARGLLYCCYWKTEWTSSPGIPLTGWTRVPWPWTECVIVW